MKRKYLKSEIRGFSLLELLVVLTIMGILSAVTVSSISSLRSTALSMAGNQVVDVFAMARQNSISKNDYTAVVILTSGTNAGTAYCLLELPSQQDGSQGTAWTQLTQWRYLPKGVVFENGQANDTFMATPPWTSLPAATSSLLSGCSFQGSPINLTTAATVQCYQPDGTLLGGQSSLTLRLIEGADVSGTISNTGGSNYYDLYFLGNTGTTKIGRP